MLGASRARGECALRGAPIADARRLNAGVRRHLSMDARLDALRTALAAWAPQQPSLRRLWIYGSRVKGSHRPDSDLDVAFEIDRLSDEHAVDEFQEITLPTWRNDLTRLTGLPIHLEPSVGDATAVTGYVSDSGMLVYERRET
jgi:predicted nucleotidyltransferase